MRERNKVESEILAHDQLKVTGAIVKLIDPEQRKLKWPVSYTGRARADLDMLREPPEHMGVFLRTQLGFLVRMKRIPDGPVRNPEGALYQESTYGKPMHMLSFDLHGYDSTQIPEIIYVECESPKVNPAIRFASYSFRREMWDGVVDRLVVTVPGLELKLAVMNNGSVRVEAGGKEYISVEEPHYSDGSLEHVFKPLPIGEETTKKRTSIQPAAVTVIG